MLNILKLKALENNIREYPYDSRFGKNIFLKKTQKIQARKKNIDIFD